MIISLKRDISKAGDVFLGLSVLVLTCALLRNRFVSETKFISFAHVALWFCERLRPSTAMVCVAEQRPK
jgi:hypothetical protein